MAFATNLSLPNSPPETNDDFLISAPIGCLDGTCGELARPVPSGTRTAEELVSPREENGFSLLDCTTAELRVSFFRWTPEQGEAALDTLEPFQVLTFPRPGRA